MFKRLMPDDRPLVSVVIDGKTVQVPAGETVAAAVLATGGTMREHPVSGRPRSAYCMMGVCFECLMRIDGLANRQACMTRVREGMRIERQPAIQAGLSESPK
ncbi:MAG: (2Fe-2S)-binding protein [Gammaproteobacteria bacterium]|nr:(2Fe-2S)-binding protein [Gammaproteobacteria bacterium]